MLPLTTNNLPSTSSSLHASHIPLSGTCTPLYESASSTRAKVANPPNPTPLSSVPRCTSCCAFVNPSCVLMGSGASFCCGLCGERTMFVDSVDEEGRDAFNLRYYSQVQQRRMSHVRPTRTALELEQQDCTFSLPLFPAAPPNPMLRPVPAVKSLPLRRCPLLQIYLIDCSLPSSGLALAAECVSRSLESAPSGCRLSVAFYGPQGGLECLNQGQVLLPRLAVGRVKPGER